MVDGFLAFKWWEFFKHFAKKKEKNMCKEKSTRCRFPGYKLFPLSQEVLRRNVKMSRNIKKCNKIETNTCFILELLLSLQKFETRNSQIRNSAGRRSTTSSLIERVISCEINISVTRYTRGRCCIVRVIGESYSITLVDAIASVN